MRQPINSSHANRLEPRRALAHNGVFARLLIICVSTAGLLPAATAFATPQSRPSASDVQFEVVSEALLKRGSIVFRDTPLAEVILILSEQWNVNIVAGAQINGNVSGTFKNETLEKILDSILTANGFGYERIGNSLVIRPAGQTSGTKPNFQVEVIDIPPSQASQVDELISALRLQMSSDGQIQALSASGKLAVSDTPERIAAVKLLLQQIAGAQAPHLVSTPNTTQGLPGGATVAPAANLSQVLELRPQYVDAKDLEASLQMVIGGGTLATIETENVIVVMADAASQEKAKLLMQQLDRPRAQVRITGYIYDVDMADVETLGVDWTTRVMSQAIDANGVPRNLGIGQSGMLIPNGPNDAAGVASTIASAATTATSTATSGATAAAANGGQFVFRTLNSDFELQAMIQALDQSDGSRLLADPHVTVVDRHKASLGIVTEVPIQQLTQTQQGGSIGTTSFREAGITLEVTPRIASDGTIEMEVSPEFSVLSGFQGGNPIIDTRRATTVVRVSHGQALVIGGLRSRTTVETIKGIPGLMNIKFLGKLFRTHSTDVRESEMVVFIMPEIVGYCGGLDREMEALDVARRQLSRVNTAIDGPFTPDCGDKHCPQHNQRPVIHNGMEDIGLIGNFDGVFVSPLPPGQTLQQQELILNGQEAQSFLQEVSPSPVSLPPPAVPNFPANQPTTPVQPSTQPVAPVFVPVLTPSTPATQPVAPVIGADAISLSGPAPQTNRGTSRTGERTAETNTDEQPSETSSRRVKATPVRYGSSPKR